jgi:hypothetical protein
MIQRKRQRVVTLEEASIPSIMMKITIETIEVIIWRVSGQIRRMEQTRTCSID